MPDNPLGNQKHESLDEIVSHNAVVIADQIQNPPWVNWESLPGTYRHEMKPLWQKYGLFSLSGSAGRLGGGKKDLAMLFVYSVLDHFLKERGKLGFVITQTVFKTKGAGDGFRKLFIYPEQAKYLSQAT